MSDAQLSSLIGNIYDTTLDPSLWPIVLEQACDFVGAIAANIFWQDASDQAAAVLYSFGDNQHYVRLYHETYIDLNPMFPAVAFVEPGIVFSGGDIVPHDEFRQTRFFKEWVAPQGFADMIGVNIQRYPTSCACFSLRRGTQHGVVDAQARHRMELIAPHVCRATLIGQQITKATDQTRDLETILDANRAAAFMIGADNKLTFVNAAGRAMLDEGRIVTEHNSILTSNNAVLSNLLRAAMAGDIQTAKDRKSISIPLNDSPPYYLADVLPFVAESGLFSGSRKKSKVAIFVRSVEIPIVSGVEAMMKLHDLRPSEVRVLHELVKDGGTVDELARRLGIAASTVKTHLNALFAKTGTSRRSDLVRQVAACGGPLS